MQANKELSIGSCLSLDELNRVVSLMMSEKRNTNDETMCPSCSKGYEEQHHSAVINLLTR